MKDYVYTSAHLSAIKKYRTTKVLFLVLGCLVVFLQSIAWLVVWAKDMPIRISDMWFVGITLIASLFFIASQCYFAIRTKRVVKTIKNEGKFSTFRFNIKMADKYSWGGAITILSRILTIVFVVLLAFLMVSFVENYVNWGKMILKVPLMVFLAVTFLNLSAEMRYQTMLEKSQD